MKISYCIACYFGPRNVAHYKQNKNPFFYLKTQLKYINNLNPKFYKIYIICTFHYSIDKLDFMNSIESIINEYNINNIVFYERDNLGGSYCSWAYAINKDGNESNIILLTEDDYVIYDENAVSIIEKEFEADNELFYYCQFWNKEPYTCNYKSIKVIPAHAALSCGAINIDIYTKLKIEQNIDFDLEYEDGYGCMCRNQARFLEPYRAYGLKLTDWRNIATAYYPHSKIEYGTPNGHKILQPIIESIIE